MKSVLLENYNKFFKTNPLPIYEESYTDDLDLLDTDLFWEDVVDDMNSHEQSKEKGYYFGFEDLSTHNSVRELVLNWQTSSGSDEELVIWMEWKSDGTPTKPVTTISSDSVGDIKLGRWAIWDDPKEVADDLVNLLIDNML